MIYVFVHNLWKLECFVLSKMTVLLNGNRVIYLNTSGHASEIFFLVFTKENMETILFHKTTCSGKRLSDMHKVHCLIRYHFGNYQFQQSLIRLQKSQTILIRPYAVNLGYRNEELYRRAMAEMSLIDTMR